MRNACDTETVFFSLEINEKLESFDGVHTAIGNAKRRMAGFINGKSKPSEYGPGTMVHILVEELLTYLE